MFCKIHIFYVKKTITSLITFFSQGGFFGVNLSFITCVEFGFPSCLRYSEKENLRRVNLQSYLIRLTITKIGNNFMNWLREEGTDIFSSTDIVCSSLLSHEIQIPEQELPFHSGFLKRYQYLQFSHYLCRQSVLKKSMIPSPPFLLQNLLLFK